MRIKEIIKKYIFFGGWSKLPAWRHKGGVNVGVDWSGLPAWRHKGGGEVYP